MNFAAQLKQHAKEQFARIPGEIEFYRSPFGTDFELRFAAEAFDYHSALRISDKRLLLEDKHLLAEISSLAEQTIEAVLHGRAPLRPGYPKAE